MSTDPPINTYFNKGSIPKAGLTPQQFEARNGLVRAYRCYFGVMFYEPLDEFIDSDPEKALHFLHEVAKIADYYDGPLAITCHVENFLNRKAIAYRNPLVQLAPVLLQISLKLKSGPLFKDAICRLAGDDTRKDKTIETELDPRMASLVLRKRDGLRQMMREIDVKLVAFKTAYDEDFDDDEGYLEYRDFVTACFRQFIAKRIFDHDFGQDLEEWPLYALKYRKLVADVSRMKLEKRFFGRQFPCSHSEKAAHLLYGKYYREAIQILWPLFTSSLSNRVRYTPNPLIDGSGDLYEGFTCVQVLDQDLPWKIS